MLDSKYVEDNLEKVIQGMKNRGAAFDADRFGELASGRRQIIKEVADLTDTDIPVHCAHATGFETFTLSELLPHGFGPANLK